MTMEYLISDLRSSIPILQKIADGQILSFDEAWSLARRLSRLKGTRLEAEVKKIKNTMFFRLPSILRIPCSLNIAVGSTYGENPNVRHRSREELLRKLVDQGYNINQYKL